MTDLQSLSVAGGRKWSFMEVLRARTGLREYYRSDKSGENICITKEEFLAHGGNTDRMKIAHETRVFDGLPDDELEALIRNETDQALCMEAHK